MHHHFVTAKRKKRQDFWTMGRPGGRPERGDVPMSPEAL
jgi:hypothetical protein